MEYRDHSGDEVFEFDHVEFEHDGWKFEGHKVKYEGQIIRLIPRKNSVEIKYATGEVYRTTCRDKMARVIKPVSEIDLIRRDG